MGENRERSNSRHSRRCFPTLIAGAALALGLALRPAAEADEPPTRFDDVSTIVDFQHLSVPFDGDGLAGAAWVDYDADGFLDLFLTNGKTRPNGLFRNDGHGGFIDVSALAGIQNGRGNSGVVAADFDNDGFADLFLTGDGGVLGSSSSPVVLYHNNGDGTFSDITASPDSSHRPVVSARRLPISTTTASSTCSF
jgi:VCBS repeat protein